MQSLSKLSFAILLTAGTILPVDAAFSAPISVPAPVVVDGQSQIQDARWVRRCNAYGCRRVWVQRRHIRPRVVVRPRVVIKRGGNRHVRWCLNNYRSYDPASDTFVTYGGDVRRCRSPFR